MIGEPSIVMSITPPQVRSSADAADHRHQRHAALADILDHRQVAALGVGVVAVDVAAEDEAALVRLADVEMPGAEGDDVRGSGFSPSETKACSTWLSIGRRSPAIAATREELPATATPTLPAPIGPRVVSTPATLPPVAEEAGDLAVLDDVDAHVGCRTRA